MKRTALDLRVFFHERRGIPRYVQNFLKSLFKKNKRGFCFFGLIPTHHNAELKNLFSDNCEFQPIYLEERSIWHWEQFLLPNWCKRNGINLLHMFTNRGPIHSKGFKDVHVVHDTIAIHEGNWERGFFPGILGFSYNFLTIRLSAKNASHLVTVSNFSRDSIIKEFGVSPSKVTVIYNGVEETFFNPPQLDLEKLGLPHKPFFFHLGSFDPRKNTERVIRGFGGLKKEIRKELPLFIAGLSSKAREKFLPLIKDLGLEKEVFLLPFVSDEELAGLYNRCFAFIWPSCWEGFGLPVLEAMAAGAPVLTSNATSLPEISGGCALLVNPFSVEEIKEGIRQLILNEKMREEMKLKGKAWAKNFTWENTVNKTMEIWRMVLED